MEETSWIGEVVSLILQPLLHYAYLSNAHGLCEELWTVESLWR